VTRADLHPDSQRSPLLLYGELFIDVQMQRVFDDAKTFADASPRTLSAAALQALYADRRGQPGFSLARFVHEHFDMPPQPDISLAAEDIRQTISGLWPRLLRSSDAAPGAAANPTLLSLPHPYIVPGGRFAEMYYWDAYFTMLGLVCDGQRSLAQGMLDNCATLIDRYGFVPNSNRSYMLSRSQPPLFYKMVECLNADDPAAGWARYQPQLLAEHRFWMSGEDQLAPGRAEGRVVRLNDGSVLNRYWDALDHPREEAYRADVLTALQSPRPAAAVYRELRAAAESGWDFSSRWCADPQRLHSIETTAIVPVDLNSLLWGLECALVAAHRQRGEAVQAQAMRLRADRRQASMHAHLWHRQAGHAVDYHWVRACQQDSLSAAALVPLYTGQASAEQAAATATVTAQRLLARHGLLTTEQTSGQQWDAPNGWAPLQWMAVQGLSRYGHDALAGEIAQRWSAMVLATYNATGRLLEKYDVLHPQGGSRGGGGGGGGGEYAVQDGFGWTNGLYLALQPWVVGRSARRTA